jgi:hypothetical protein
MTILVCNPLDEQQARWEWRNGEHERMVVTERCPSQVILHMADRLLLMVQSGAWFDLPEAEEIAAAQRRRDELVMLLDGVDRVRCCALNQNGTQCKRPAEIPVLPSEQVQRAYCVMHSLKRKMWVHRIGEGLAEVSPNPMSEVTMDALSALNTRLGTVIWQFSNIAGRLADLGEASFTAGTAFAELCDIREELVAVLRGDREKAEKQRRELRLRIQDMIRRIERAKNIEGREVHTAYMRAGGKSQMEMNVEELKTKIDWMFTAYADVFPADTREWQPPDVPTSGMEPGGIRLKRPDDPVIEVEEDSEHAGA